MSAALFAVTDATTADAFLRPHLRAAADAGQRTYLMSGDGPVLRAVADDVGATPVPLDLHRNPDPARDLRALATAFARIRAVDPGAVHVGTPKAGLIVGLAARLARVPTRVYVLHGLRYESATGLRRRLFRLMERLACRSATQVVAVSETVRRRAIADHLVAPGRILVLGQGSISGVDAARFARDPVAGSRFRQHHGIDPGAQVVLFVGRLSLDKGIRELRDAWASVAAAHPCARLVVVGAVDAAQPAAESVLTDLRSAPGVVVVGELPDPAPAYSAADVLVLPTYREGFGTVVLEAAAAGLPTIASDVTGCRDSVQHDVTGLLVRPRDAAALAETVVALLSDPRRAETLGRHARARAVRDFAPVDVVGRYARLLQ